MKFEVLNVVEEVTRVKFEYRKNAEGTRYRVPVYYKLKRGEKDHNGNVWVPSAYGNENIKVGDTIEVEGKHFIEKARSNPDFKEVRAK